MKVIIDYKFCSMNEYIGQCRANYHYANDTKQKETMLSAMVFSKLPKIENYPIELIFKWHMREN